MGEDVVVVEEPKPAKVVKPKFVEKVEKSKIVPDKIISKRMVDKKVDMKPVKNVVQSKPVFNGPIEGKVVVGVDKFKGRKWMKFAGWIGVVFMVFFVLLILLAVLKVNTQSNILGIILGVVVFILAMFFLYGFVKMGRKTDSKLLVFSGKALIISSIVLVILMAVVIIIAYVYLIPMIQDVVMESLATGGLEYAGITGNAVGDGGLSTGFTTGNIVPWWVWVVGIVLILFYLFILFLQVLFFVGLIKAGKQVRFAKWAGILGLIVLGISVFLILYLFLNPMAIALMMYAGVTTIFWVIQIGLSVLGFVVFILETLALFDASKKFE